jgi:hypothetical protein
MGGHLAISASTDEVYRGRPCRPRVGSQGWAKGKNRRHAERARCQVYGRELRRSFSLGDGRHFNGGQERIRIARGYSQERRRQDCGNPIAKTRVDMTTLLLLLFGGLPRSMAPRWASRLFQNPSLPKFYLLKLYFLIVISAPFSRGRSAAEKLSSLSHLLPDVSRRSASGHGIGITDCARLGFPHCYSAMIRYIQSNRLGDGIDAAPRPRTLSLWRAATCRTGKRNSGSCRDGLFAWVGEPHGCRERTNAFSLIGWFLS